MNPFLLTAVLFAAAPEAQVPPADVTFAVNSGFGVLAQYAAPSGDLSQMTVAGALSASLRWSLLELGATARGELGGGNGTHLGGYFGFVDRLPSGNRYELAASFGVHRVTQLGAGRSGGSLGDPNLLGPSSVTSGIDAELPFVGLRLGAYHLVNPERANHLVLGAVLYADVDARNVRGTQVTQSTCGLFDNGPNCPRTSTSSVDATIGTAGLMLFVGWTHDLGQ